MAEPTYRVLEILAQLLVLATGTRITYVGEENVPDQGGAVVAINHTSYVDWLPAALAMHRRRRRMRFMIKAEMQRVRLVNFLIRHTRTIPVDRGAGGSAYAVAVQRPNDWGLGFEIRNSKSPHWTGECNSTRTFGHFGQSGGFIWVDPKADLALVVLTARDFGDWALDLWPAISDAVLAEYT